MRTVALILLVALGGGWTNIAGAQGSEIVHDAEYYILEAQNGEKWAAEDAALDKSLPNCVPSTAHRPTSSMSCGTTRPLATWGFQRSTRFAASRLRA